MEEKRIGSDKRRWWLGIIRDLRTALLRDPVPAEVVKELLASW